MARTELTPKERDRRLQSILTAAKDVFLKNGYFNTTMSDIATASGISRRTIYLYFKNKDDLSYEIVLNAFIGLYDNIEDKFLTNKNGYDKLLDIKAAYIDYYNTRFADLIFTMYFDFKINTQILKDKQLRECFHIIGKVVDIIDQCLKDGMADGSIRDSITDTRRLSIATMNVIHATMQKLAVRSDIIDAVTNYSSEELINEMFDLFFQSIKA